MDEWRIGRRKLHKEFATVMQRVEGGDPVTVTSHGEPIARIVPEGEAEAFWEHDRESLCRAFASADDKSRKQPSAQSAKKRRSARTLVLRSVTYWSQADESAFFQRLDALGCVDSYRGVGIDLLVSLKPERLDEDTVDDLMALFYRYEIRQAAEPLRRVDSLQPYFADRTGYWELR